MLPTSVLAGGLNHPLCATQGVLPDYDGLLAHMGRSASARSRAAVTAVIEAYRDAGRAIYSPERLKMGGLHFEAMKAELWLERMRLHYRWDEREPEARLEGLEPLQEPSQTEIYSAWEGWKRVFFRPLRLLSGGGKADGNVAAVRGLIAASALADFLQVPTVARSRVARVRVEIPKSKLGEQDLWGVISEYVEGTFSEAKLARTGRTMEAIAFEYLIGNEDARPHNYKVRRKNEILAVFDYDMAFRWHVRWRGEFDDNLGSDLPKLHTRRFVERLRMLSDTALQEVIGVHLTESELAAVRFRRDVLLKDVEIREGNGEPVYID